MSIDGCLFDNNYASNKGGGAEIGTGQASIVNSRFVTNVAGSDNVESGEWWATATFIRDSDNDSNRWLKEATAAGAAGRSQKKR